MKPEEYANLDAVERDHWYYSGKRQLVRYWLGRACGLKADQLLVDCGAGTGFFAWEMRDHCRVLAVDDHQESLELARGRLGQERVRCGGVEALPLRDGEADVVTALDVLEHVPDDRRALGEILRVLKPGGWLVLTVPAMMMLWSDWDESLHHCRRYEKAELLARLREGGWILGHCDFTNVAAFPAVWAARKLRRWRGAPASGKRAEDAIPPCVLNDLLRWLFVAPACQTLVKFPYGVSLLAVARKPVRE